MTTTVRRIRRLGFRKWYERELLHSHANLVLLLLAVIGLLGSLEASGGEHGLADRLVLLATAAVSAGVAVLALRRYIGRLATAEHVADQAVCGGCEAYGRFEPIGEEDGGRITVRCRHCGHRWPIEL